MRAAPASRAQRRYAVALGVALLALPQTADAEDLRSERQESIAHVLNGASYETVRAIRSTCAAGKEAASVAENRAAGLIEQPDAVDYCVTALTRLGRDGTLGFIKDAHNNIVTAALAFDRGFVTAFRNREAVTPDLPGMAVLKPVAARCLTQREPNADLCSAAGYALGTRAYHGETVIVQ